MGAELDEKVYQVTRDKIGEGLVGWVKFNYVVNNLLANREISSQRSSDFRLRLVSMLIAEKLEINAGVKGVDGCWFSSTETDFGGGVFSDAFLLRIRADALSGNKDLDEISEFESLSQDGGFFSVIDKPQGCTPNLSKIFLR